ncbi:MAG: cobalamin biosynthesis protein [Thermoproteota archaeon]|nr:cobalamin biosynthesis protein [Thermoproteota archaeon]
MIQILQEIILVTCFSISFDYLIGEPPNSIHPVVWIGKCINFFTIQIKKNKNLNKKYRLYEKICGSVLALSLTSIIGILTYLIIIQSLYIFGTVVFILLSTFILKSMFSIKAMDKHIKDILKNIEKKILKKLVLIYQRLLAEIQKLYQKKIYCLHV